MINIKCLNLNLKYTRDCLYCIIMNCPFMYMYSDNDE